MVIYGEAVRAAIRRRAEREGLKLHLASYGGSGTVFTAEWLHRHRLRCMTPVWHAVLNHYAVPIDLGVPRLCLLADPPTAYASVRRRGIAESVARHLHGGQYGRDLIAGMEAFFAHWIAASPVVICKYEALHNYLGEIGQALGIDFRNFPPLKPRKSHAEEEGAIDDRLVALRRRFESLPDIIVR